MKTLQKAGSAALGGIGAGGRSWVVPASSVAQWPSDPCVGGVGGGKDARREMAIKFQGAGLATRLPVSDAGSDDHHPVSTCLFANAANARAVRVIPASLAWVRSGDDVRVGRASVTSLGSVASTRRTGGGSVLGKSAPRGGCLVTGAMFPAISAECPGLGQATGDGETRTGGEC